MDCHGRARAWATSLVTLLLLTSLFQVGCGGGTGDRSTDNAKPEASNTEPSSDVSSGTGANGESAVPSDPMADYPRPLDDDELNEGWLALFDGKTLYGWHHDGQSNWQVTDETITVDQGPINLLTTTTRFSDYVLRLEFQAETTTNSGIFLRTPRSPEAPARDCYELNIAPDDNPFPTGSLVGRQKIDPQSASQARQRVDNNWHRYEVTVRGDHVSVLWNDVPVMDYTDPTPLPRGFIGLQLNQGRVAFRNVRLKPLGLQTILPDEGLEGWKTRDDLRGEFKRTSEGWLHVTGGRGQIESPAAYANFVLQLECRTNAPRLNTGVFFRCIPGDLMMGYESQIHNGFQNSDRRQPEDCGTGGIFRRQDARFVAADDQSWFLKTIIADDDHFAVWVNGVQVTDWTDDRKPDDNPRKGLRRAAGTIMLQAHDETTDVDFRNLQVAEFAP